ncbi:MAG TPA: SxtJ family membrane protein [Myxococcaceae bacterium]|nr:SxtJ family membrane protein [Myxococcaceae bacterium]
MSWTEDVRAGRARLDTSPRALRRAAFAVGGVLLLLAGWLVWRDRAPGVRLPLAGAAAALVLAGALVPARLRGAYLAWMTVALAIGWVMSRVVLTLVFAAVLTPLALLARLTGKRFLALGPDRTASSYWVQRERGSRGRYERMY